VLASKSNRIRLDISLKSILLYESQKNFAITKTDLTQGLRKIYEYNNMIKSKAPLLNDHKNEILFYNDIFYSFY